MIAILRSAKLITFASFLCVLCLLLNTSALADADRPFTDVRGSLSGSWFDSSRNGEGFVFEFGKNPGSPAITVYWFTHKDGEPYWLFGAIEYEAELFDETGLLEVDMIEVSGTGFGEDFDSDELEQFDRGTLSFVFEGCNQALASWTPNEDLDVLGTETLDYELRRITLGLDGVACGNTEAATEEDINTSPPQLQGALSGSWFDSSRNGEGFVFEFGMNPDSAVATVYWFTHRDGKPYWLFGIAPYEGDEPLLDFDLLDVSGTGFGTDFDSDEISITFWGEASFGFISCDSGLAIWGDGEGATGSFDLRRITLGLDGVACLGDDPDLIKAEGTRFASVGESISLTANLDESAASDTSGFWIIKAANGTVYKTIDFSESPSKSFEVSKPGLYEAQLLVSSPRKATSTTHYFAVATELSGNVIQDTVLDLSGSPYRLTEDIQIRQDSTLSIDPGVMVLGSGYSIRTFGNLIIQGTATQPITTYDLNLVTGATNSAGPYFSMRLDNVIMVQGSLYPPGNAGYGSITSHDSLFLNLKSYTYIWYPVEQVMLRGNPPNK